MNISFILSKILDLLYFRTCYICSSKCSEISICQNCYDKIFSNLKFHSANKFSTTIYSGAAYENELLKIIRAFKYHKKQEFEKILSDIIIQTIEHYNIDVNSFIVCPVPIHKSRYKKRKYNHMELVAANVANHFNLNMEKNLLFRTKDTPPLYKLKGNERTIAIQHAFEASNEIKNKNILLLDDIVTTGSTIKELSKIIYKQGAGKLLVICATRSNNCNF